LYKNFQKLKGDIRWSKLLSQYESLVLNLANDIASSNSNVFNFDIAFGIDRFLTVAPSNQWIQLVKKMKNILRKFYYFFVFELF